MKTLRSLFFPLALATGAFAQTYTWNAGGGGLTGIADASNWVDNAVPPNDGTAALVLIAPTNSAAKMDINTAYSVLGVTFGTTTQSSFDIFGAQTLTLGGAGLTNATTSNWSFASSANLALSANQAWTAASGSAGFSQVGNLNLDQHTLEIRNSSSYPIELGGAITGPGGVAVTSGTLRLSGIAPSNGFTGGISLLNANSRLYLRGGAYDGAVSTADGSHVQIGFPSATFLGAISGPGRLTIDSSIIVTFSSAQTYTGNLELNSGSKVILAHDEAIPDHTAGGQILLNDGSATFEASGSSRTIGRELVFNGAHSVTFTGTHSFGLNVGIQLMSGGTQTISASNSGGIEINGVISQSNPSVAANLNLTGLLRFTGSNTYTGTTTVNGANLTLNATSGTAVLAGGPLAVINNGAVRLENSHLLPDSTVLSLAGQIEPRGTTEVLGALTLTGNSVLRFGTGDNALSFASSSPLAWNEGTTLTVVEFTVGSDSLRFGTNAEGLTPGQLSAIVFEGFGPGAQIDALGFVTPASAISTPEPARGGAAH